jgi:hypothetical protein
MTATAARREWQRGQSGTSPSKQWCINSDHETCEVEGRHEGLFEASVPSAACLGAGVLIGDRSPMGLRAVLSLLEGARGKPHTDKAGFRHAKAQDP